MTFKVTDISTLIQNGGFLMNIWGILAELCHYLETIFTDLENQENGTSNGNPTISPNAVSGTATGGVVAKVENGVKVAEQVVSEAGKVFSPVEEALQRLAKGL